MPTALDLDLWLANAFPGGRSPPLSRKFSLAAADRRPWQRSDRTDSLVGNMCVLMRGAAFPTRLTLIWRNQK